MTAPDGPTPSPTSGLRAAPITIISVICLLTGGGLGALQALGRADQVPALFGSVSSWITAGSVTGILALLVWLQLGNRKLRIEEMQAEHKDEADLRDHYAEELSKLRERLDEAAARHAKDVVEIEGKYRRLIHETEEHYQALLRESEAAHEECRKDRKLLIDEIAAMREEIAGMRRQILAQATDRVLELGDVATPAARGAARRVRRRLGRGADSKSES